MPSLNRLALVSLISATMTVLSFCVGFAPIPMTALFCYPFAALGGLVAMLTGWLALRQIRVGGEGGRWMAWAGLLAGGISLLAVICFSILTMTLFPILWNWVGQAWQSIQQWFAEVRG